MTTTRPWKRCSPAGSVPSWPSRPRPRNAGDAWPRKRPPIATQRAWARPTRPRTRRPPRARRRFAYPPQLLLIDGGKGQLGVGIRVVEELGLAGQIQLAALAKQFEEVYRPGMEDPIRIARGTEALYLLQRVRDEAHRFAISFHRQQRGARMTTSALDGVPGLGPTRRASS